MNASSNFVLVGLGIRIVPHRRRLGERADPSVGPQVGAAHAGDRDPDDGSGWLNNLGLVAFLETDVSERADALIQRITRFQMLCKEGHEFVERNKLHPIVEVNVAGVGNDD